MAQEPPESSEQIVRQALELLSARLPSGWKLQLVAQPSSGSDPGKPDRVAQIVSPSGEDAVLIVEAKRLVQRRDVGRIQEVLQQQADGVKGRGGMLASRYLSPQVRAELDLLGISYIDATGNMRVSLTTPALYIGDRGADSDPWRGVGRPRATLTGEPAARVVRTLVDYARVWRIRDLVDESHASVGATYRVIDYLHDEGLISRNGSEIAVPDWRPLLRAWSSDYNSTMTNRTRRYIEPRGLNSLLSRAAETETLAYAVTGSVAANEWAPYAPPRSAFIYVSSIEDAEKRWSLRSSEASSNVVLIEPKSVTDIVFANTSRRSDGLLLAAQAQVAVDLMNGPGRNPSEADELLEWMSKNESLWRR